jgi:hypothetical protein
MNPQCHLVIDGADIISVGKWYAVRIAGGFLARRGGRIVVEPMPFTFACIASATAAILERGR